MKHSKTASTQGEEGPVFSIVAGGPTYRLMVRAHLAGPTMQLLRRRMAALFAIVWMPLLLLAMIEGNALAGPGVSFLEDVAAHARFLVAMPLLLVAEWLVARRMREANPLFLERGIVGPAQRGRFTSIVASAQRWVDWTPAEVALLLLAYAVGFGHLMPQEASIAGATWYGSTLPSGQRVMTMAGWWLAAVSLPLFQFLLLRWYYRLLVWWRFLFQVASVELELEPLHPDRVGGLSFISRLSSAFIPLLLAQSALTAGLIADQIFYAGATLADFRLEIALVCAVMLFLVVGPLLAFVPPLSRAKLAGLAATEALAMRFAQEFGAKWLHGKPPADEPLLGNADVQSLADLGGAYESMRSMRVVPLRLPVFALLCAAALVPMLPLLLTTFSAEELFSRVVKVLL